MSPDSSAAAPRPDGDLTGLSAAELATRIGAREVSSVEVTQAQLDRIAEIDDQLGAFLHVRGAEALVAAGVSRVVAAMRDPFPRVDGAGFARAFLKAKGVSHVDAVFDAFDAS